MALFEVLDGGAIAAKIRHAGWRVVLCAPGFDDRVGTALIEANRRLPEGSVEVLVDGSLTYETLNDPSFQAAVRNAYPLVDFDKPFKEFPAARGNLSPIYPVCSVTPC